MSDTPTAIAENRDRRFGGFPWLKVLLVVSLALNLLLLGGAAARHFTQGAPERITGMSNMQMIPRKFLSELDRRRRAELLAVLRGYRDEFRAHRRTGREQMGRLAAALEAEPYSEDAVRHAVEAFTGSSADLMRRGGDAALAFIGRLSPDERRLLARHIRMRDDGGRKRQDGRGKDD